MLIDHTYFVGEMNIPGTGTPAVRERLAHFIKKYEAELLPAILGVELAEAFAAGMAQAAPNPKWTELRDGKAWTDSTGVAHRWRGLRDEDAKQSFIAAYVYYWWLRDRVSRTTETGEVVDKSEGSTPASSIAKQVRAWNEVAEAVSELVAFLDHHSATYPEWASANRGRILRDFLPINAWNL